MIPVFVGNLKTNSIIDDTPSTDALNNSKFTKDNYSAILTNDNNGLGSVTVDEMHFNYYQTGIDNHTEFYPLLDNDLSSFALDLNTTNVEFIKTINPAIYDNLNGTIKQSITVKLNESLIVVYNNPQEGYLVYFSHFAGARLLDFYVDDGSSIIKLKEGIDYTLDSDNFIVFYYEDYFQQGSSFNFTMHLIWEWSIGLSEWSIEQREEAPLIITGREQDFTSRFLYKFFIIGYMVIPDLSGTTQLDYIEVAVTIHPPDKELLTYKALNINGIDRNIVEYINPDKSLSIPISDLLAINNSFILFNSTYNFRLKFEEPVGNSWAVDRLVDGRNIRERIYFVSMVTGPPHIFLKNVALYDKSIFIDQVISSNSLFNRDVFYFDANASVPRQPGLMLKIPYLIVGETCPFTIRYSATQTLKILVTDNIKMPLIGANIEILLFGAIYGTYIANKSSQPIYPGTTDGNGQFVLYDVPHGNYTVRVIYQGKIVKETIIDTNEEVNYVFTSVPHFPLLILIFGMTSVIILAIGALFYNKYKKFR